MKIKRMSDCRGVGKRHEDRWREKERRVFVYVHMCRTIPRRLTSRFLFLFVVPPLSKIRHRVVLDSINASSPRAGSVLRYQMAKSEGTPLLAETSSAEISPSCLEKKLIGGKLTDLIVFRHRDEEYFSIFVKTDCSFDRVTFFAL
ncbi:hypothetical protein PUN28_018669 [Cardiocondyla obscurior]|uniref:Uncharacterized protein n=1 Tax=Cardiocondyla obscurior TaxID=286306 RepID=A0AAW2EH27_9HYME